MTIPASAIALPPKDVPDRYDGVTDAEGFARLASRPNAIEPKAVTFFKQWIVGCVDIDPGTGTVVLKPEFSPIGSRPVPATSLGSGLGMKKASGDGQSGTPGGILGPVKVKVTDASGNRAGGAAVVFRAKGFGASVGGRATTSRITDVNGEAEINDWRLGFFPGTYQLEVAVAGATVTFTATAA